MKNKIIIGLGIFLFAVIPIVLFSSNNDVPIQNVEKKVSAVEIQQIPSSLYSVVDVIDGDTVKIDMDGKVVTLRLIGLDTPETVDPRKSVQCFGREASNKAKETLSGKKVRVEKDLSQGEYDKYGRTLAYLYREDGLFYNEFMIEQGYAHEYTYNIPYAHQKEFKEAQDKAREGKLGLWSLSTCGGDTTEPAKTAPQATPSRSVAPASSVATQSSGIYYTSSYGTSKYYYPASCNGWKSLSPKYLKSFDSLEKLLSVYPSRTESPQCK